MRERAGTSGPRIIGAEGGLLASAGRAPSLAYLLVAPTTVATSGAAPITTACFVEAMRDRS